MKDEIMQNVAAAQGYDSEAYEELVAEVEDVDFDPAEPIYDIEEDETNPGYYKLPDGSEVVQVTRWLTSNGGQAVQYVARATRVDGITKGGTFQEQVQDLRKARWFLDDEIARLEEVIASAGVEA